MSNQLVARDATVYRSLNTPQHQKEDLELMLRPFCNWQNLIICAPTSIAILGQIMLVSGKVDFCFEKSVQYEHIKYPDSFRATLVQLANKGWHSFNTANKNMDQIRLYSHGIPNHIRTAAQTLINGNNREIPVLLPDQLQIISNAAEQCKLQAEEVEASFLDTMLLIEEILEASQLSQGVHQKKVQNTKAFLVTKQKEKEEIEKRKQEDEERYAKMVKEFNEANEQIKKAIEELPGTATVIASHCLATATHVIKQIDPMKVFYTSVALVTGDIMGVHSLINAAIKDFKTPTRDSSANNTNTHISIISNDKPPTIIMSLRYLSVQNLNFEFLNETQTDGQLDITKIQNKEVQIKICYFMNELKFVSDKVTEITEKDSYKDLVLRTIKKTQDVFQQVLDASNQINTKCDNSKLKEKYQRKIDKLRKLIIKAETKSLLTSSVIALPTAGPCQSRYELAQADDNLSNQVTKTSQFQFHQVKEQFKMALEREEKARDEMNKTNEKLLNTLHEMANMKLNEINFDNIRNILNKGIAILAELKKQWSQLVQLFTVISNIIKITMSTNVKALTDTLNNQSKLKVGNVPYSELQKDRLFKEVMMANNIAYVVNNISNRYCEISQKYIMPGVASLNKLMALDHDEDTDEIIKRQASLRSDCDRAIEEIRREGEKDSQEIHQKLETRIEQFEGLMPAITADKQQELNEAIEEAKQEVRESEKDVHFVNVQLNLDTFM